MRKLLASILLGTSLALSSGCAMFQPLDTSKVVEDTLPAPVQEVKSIIAESRVLMISIALTYQQELADGLVTVDQANAMGAKLKGYATLLKQADEALDKGDVLSAKNKADIVHVAVVELHRLIVKKANQ